MASTQSRAIGNLPKLPNLALVLVLLMSLQAIVETHAMATDHASTAISRNDVEDVSPTPTLRIWTDESTTATGLVPSATPKPCCEVSAPVYGLGAQPRLFVAPKKDDDSGRRAMKDPTLEGMVAVATDHGPKSRIGSSDRAPSLSTMDSNRTADRNSTAANIGESVTSWILAPSPTLLVTRDATASMDETVPSKATHERASRLPLFISEISVPGSVRPTAVPSGVNGDGDSPEEAAVEVIRAVTSVRPRGSGGLAVESSMRTLEPRGALVTSRTEEGESTAFKMALESDRLLSSVYRASFLTSSATFLPSVESSRLQANFKTAAIADPELATGGANGTASHDNPTHSSTYADVQSANDSTESSDRNGTTGNLIIAPTSSSNFTAFVEQTNANVLMMSTAVDVAIGQPSSDSQVQRESNLPAGTVAGIVIASIGFIGILAVVLGLFVIKRLRGLANKTYDNKFSGDSCSYLDNLQVSYINNHIELPKESSEEMFSLDNDSFLNSLEAMTMENYWAEDRKSTKV